MSSVLWYTRRRDNIPSFTMGEAGGGKSDSSTMNFLARNETPVYSSYDTSTRLTHVSRERTQHNQRYGDSFDLPEEQTPPVECAVLPTPQLVCVFGPRFQLEI